MINYNRGAATILCLLLVSFFYMTACQDSLNPSFEESVAPYLELQAIEGASNTNVTVSSGIANGLDSYFAIDLSNIKGNGLVREGLTEGWCLEWDKPIRQNNDTHVGVEMFNTFGSDNWKPANYLMNIRNELKAEIPELTYKEIQVALWSLIDTPRFNIDEVLQEGRMPSRMMTNGEPNFDVEKTKQIVNRVRNEVKEFEYKTGTPVIVYSKTDDSEQNVGVVIVNGEYPNGWYFTEESLTGNGEGSYVIGPDTPPLGSGSAMLEVFDGDDRSLLAKNDWRGVRLDQITSLSYSTYRSSGSDALAISLQINIDYDETDGDTGWQGRLSYEPYYTNTVNTGEWQNWNTLDDTGSGNWWGSGGAGAAVCPISNPCTWSEVLSNFPNAAVRDAWVTGLLFKAGGGWTSGFKGNVDNFEIGINNYVTIYDFEQ